MFMERRADVFSLNRQFIIEGLVTIAVATAAIFLLADYPATTRWLSEDEKTVAQARLALDVGSEDSLDEEDVGVLRSLSQAMKDYRVWIFACMQMATTASISYSHFFPTLIQNLGFKNKTVVLLLTSPPYVCGFVFAICMAWTADNMQVRSTFAGSSAVIALLGGIISVSLPSDAQWPRYAMMFLLVCGTYGVYTTTYTWLSSTIVKPPSKRAASIGIANSLANFASFYGNYFWLDKYQPDFTESWVCVIAFLALCLGCIVALRVLLNRQNKKLDALAQSMADGGVVSEVRLSDEEVRAVRQGFRYVI